jgi:hypothetical protein
MPGAAVVTTGVVVTGAGAGVAGWVQPVMKIPATIKRPMMRRSVFFEVIMYRHSFARR